MTGLPDPRLAHIVSNAPLSAWPPVSDDKHAVLAAMCFQFDRTQWLSSIEIATRQAAQLATLVDFHARHTPAFAARLADARLCPGDISDAADLARLPELSRAMVQSTMHRTPEAAMPPMHLPTGTVNTSGSTGEPVELQRSSLNRLHWLAMSVRFHLWAEGDLGARLAVIRANVATHGAVADWGAPMNLLWRTGPMLLIDIETDIDTQLDMLADFAPDSVIIYPTNLAALHDAMSARGITLPSVKHWRTLGETLTGDLREHIAIDGDAPVIDCYSCEEAGYLAVQCPDHPALYHVMSETVLIELVDDAGQPVVDGDIGRVVLTDLHNLAAPVIRYAIGDHAMAGPPCPCGRGLPTLRRIMGRTRNMIVKPDGSRHWPLTGYKQFRRIAPIRQYQFRQHAPMAIEVRLVTDRPLTPAEEAALTAHIQWKLRHPFAINYRYFTGRLPTGHNGKFEEFVSLL